ncbi:tyrosine-type recombinase/integrase [Novosphingobium humi]|uniref:Tyrosine-type recombinase/integrase n=1 Tax=Novosphingobium humi TaxID=2282397 RepID=A0ABY7TTK5_9SPHN|nr:site-specific integrase [Novosphingobium humi]WCT76326.1 tyrosine-type recombinase/integrase [Novosphingobium humi]
MATKLSDAKIRDLTPPDTGQVEHADSEVPGLRVRIGTSGARTFILRKRVDGKIRNVTLGRFAPRFGIVEARRKARALISDIEAGKGVQPPKAKGAVAARTISGMLPDYLKAKAHLRSHADTKRILEGYVVPELGTRLADTITRADVTTLIDKIAVHSPSRARATHAQLSAFYTWAMPRLDRLPANPCRDAGRPEKPKARDRVLTDDELAGLWRIADAEPAPWGPAVKLLILTGQRRSEVFGAEWSEFDLAAKEWTVPPERSKNGIANIVPLSGEAMAVITALDRPEGGGKVFPARGAPENGASGFSKLQARFRKSLDEDLGREAGPHWQMHDIRRTVATGLQKLGIRFEVTEAVLNHLSGARGGIAGVYQRHDWKEEKRAALNSWAISLREIISKGLENE